MCVRERRIENDILVLLVKKGGKNVGISIKESVTNSALYVCRNKTNEREVGAVRCPCH